MAAAHTHHAHGSMTQLPKHRTAMGSYEVISRPCSNPKCGKLQVRMDHHTGYGHPFEWACGYCGRVDLEECPPTKRELEVVALICDGKSSKEIATALGISTKTAETHRSNIMRKLKVNCVALLVRWAVRNNVVDRWAPPVPFGATRGMPQGA